MSTFEPTPLTDAAYHHETQRVLATIEAQVDRWLQEDVIDVDAGRTGGLLELSMPDRSKLIINTQPPLHEIWLAAKSGGYHFKFSAGQWRDTRDGAEFFERLSQCASAQAGQTLAIAPPTAEVPR